MTTLREGVIVPNTQAKRGKIRLLAGAALLTAFGLAAHPVHAATPTYTVVNLTVNTTADNPAAICGTPGNPAATPPVPPHISGACSLRGAATFSNTASSAGHYYAINVAVPNGTYFLTPANGPITFTNPYSKTFLNGSSEYYVI